MEANELRIRNLVRESYGGIYEVRTISYAGYLGLGKEGIKTYGHFLIEDIKPIPLTEEWLLKFGFLKNGSDEYRITETDFELMLNEIIGFQLLIEGQHGYCEIKYVHQLQNLYFALTGEELSAE